MHPTRKLLAILSADVVDYTRLMGDDERATLRSLLTVRKIVSVQVVRHGGRLIDVIGDAMLASFASAIDSVRCAAAVQRDLERRNEPVPAARRMLLRVGINLGDVIERESSLYGDGVNVAARLERLCEPGGVCISGALHDQVEGRVPLRFRESGEQRLRNVARPVRVYHAIGLGPGTEPGPPPPEPPPEPPARTNLLHAADTLLGRAADVAELASLLPAHRLVTVVGAGGIGKTRLVQEVARQRLGHHAHGVWWVDLSALSAPQELTVAIANAANLQLGDGDRAELLLRALSVCDTLIVLDNCELLASEIAPLVHRMLVAAPRVSVLATSQAVLLVKGEHVYRLEPLGVPEIGTALTEARGYGAIQLLEQRARAADRHFELTPASVDQAIDLCRGLDGIALAIEMAAAHVPVMGLDALDRQLVDRLRSRARTGVPQRQQTLRAMLDWSHALLGRQAQRALARLSTFNGSFARAPARHVADPAATDAPWDPDEAIDELVDKSLLQIEPGERVRYRLLETTRAYAAERLEASGRAGEARDRHAAAMSTLALEMEHAFWCTPDAPWLQRYARDYADLQAAFEHACRHAAADTGAALASALLRIDRLRSVHAALRGRAEAALALMPHAGARARAMLWDCVAPHGLLALGTIPRLDAAREAERAWRQVDDRERLSLALGNLATESSRVGDDATADRSLDEMFALQTPNFPPRLRLFGAAYAGAVCGNRGDAAGYRRWSGIELELAGQAGASRAAAWARLKLADAALMAGDVGAAVEIGRASVDALRALQQPSNLGLASSNLCAALLMAGDLAAARDAAAQALPLMISSDWGYLVLDPIALIAARSGQPAQAAQLLGHVDAWYEAHHGPRQQNEVELARLTLEAIDAALPRAQSQALRASGAVLDAATAHALAQHTLRATPGGPAQNVPG